MLIFFRVRSFISPSVYFRIINLFLWTSRSQLCWNILLLLHVNFHLPFENFVCPLQTLLKNLNKCVQVISCVSRHQVYPKSGLTNLHHWILYPVHMHSFNYSHNYLNPSWFSLLIGKRSHFQHIKAISGKDSQIPYNPWLLILPLNICNFRWLFFVVVFLIQSGGFSSLTRKLLLELDWWHLWTYKLLNNTWDIQ